MSFTDAVYETSAPVNVRAELTSLASVNRAKSIYKWACEQKQGKVAKSFQMIKVSKYTETVVTGICLVLTESTPK